MRKLCVWLAAAVVLLAAGQVSAQTNGPVVVKAVDSAVPAASFNVGSTSDNSLRVRIVASDVSSSGGTSAADGAAYVASTTAGTPAMGARDDASVGTVAEDKLGIVRITTNRAMHMNLRDVNGAETGVAALPLQVSLANTGANATAVKVDGSAVTQPANVAQINGVTPLMGNGASGTGAQRVTIANDSTGIISLTTSTAQIGHLEANQSVNLAQIAGNTTSVGNGVAGTGVQRVTIASDNTAFSVNASQTGTWTVQPGNTANTSQWLVKSGPFDACGTTTYDPASALIATNTLDTLTSTTTCVDSIVVANVGASEATITVQDIQGTPVQLLKVVPVAPGATISLTGLAGVKFASGIKYQASAANLLSIWVKGRQ